MKVFRFIPDIDNYNLYYRYIVTDCYGLEAIVDRQNYLNDTKEEAVAKTIKAGFRKTQITPF